MDNHETLLTERIKASTDRVVFAPPALSPVIRRGRRRRSLVRVGQSVCAAALVLAIVLPLVALLPLDDAPNSHGPATVPANWVTASIPGIGWTYRYPPDWRSQPLRFFSDGIGSTAGSLVSNKQLRFGHPSHPGFKTPKWDMRVLPPDGVAMAITAGGGTVLPMPPGISSVLTHPAAVKYSGDARSYQRVFVEGTSRIVVTAWIGRASSQDDRTALASVIRSIAEAPGGGVVDGGTPSAAPPAAFPAVYFPPTFEGADGWHNRDSGLAAAGAGAVAWASTTAFDPADISPKAPAIPPNTIAALPADGIVMVAEVTPWTFDPADGPWPASAEQPLDLSQAQLRGPVAEEPPGNYSVLELDNRYTTVRVYFGTDAPSAALIQQAQAELDRLRVPPVCPTPSKGGYEASLSVDSGAPGDTVTISGPMPIQGPDGSFDHAGQTSIAAWWNVSPGDWTDLAPGATTPPSPAGSGPVVRLGEGGLGACSFTISFTVPQAPPGTYPIVPIEQNPESATSLPALTFRITG